MCVCDFLLSPFSHVLSLSKSNPFHKFFALKCVSSLVPDEVASPPPLFSRTYYEDWAFILDEERASMLPTMAAGEDVFSD